MQNLFSWLHGHWPVISVSLFAIASEVLGESNFESGSVMGFVWRSIRDATKGPADEYLKNPPGNQPPPAA